MNNILSVLILNRNNSNDVLKIWKDLQQQDFSNFNFVVVDDNSDKENLDILHTVKHKAFYVYSYPSPWKFDIDTKFFWGLKKCITKSSVTICANEQWKRQQYPVASRRWKDNCQENKDFQLQRTIHEFSQQYSCQKSRFEIEK